MCALPLPALFPSFFCLSLFLCVFVYSLLPRTYHSFSFPLHHSILSLDQTKKKKKHWKGKHFESSKCYSRQNFVSTHMHIAHIMSDHWVNVQEYTLFETFYDTFLCVWLAGIENNKKLDKYKHFVGFQNREQKCRKSSRTDLFLFCVPLIFIYGETSFR